MQQHSSYTREFYLLGHKFVIRMDQRSLKSLTDQAIQTRTTKMAA